MVSSGRVIVGAAMVEGLGLFLPCFEKYKHHYHCAYYTYENAPPHGAFQGGLVFGRNGCARGLHALVGAVGGGGGLGCGGGCMLPLVRGARGLRGQLPKHGVGPAVHYHALHGGARGVVLRGARGQCVGLDGAQSLQTFACAGGVGRGRHGAAVVAACGGQKQAKGEDK